MLRLQRQYGRGVNQFVSDDRFHALSGFFQSTGDRAATDHHQMDLPRRKRGTFSASGISPHNPAARARQAWRCSAAPTVRRSRHRHVYLPVDYRADCWLYRSVFLAATPRSLTVCKAEELFGEEISEEDKRYRRKRNDQVADLC